MTEKQCTTLDMRNLAWGRLLPISPLRACAVMSKMKVILYRAMKRRKTLAKRRKYPPTLLELLQKKHRRKSLYYRFRRVQSIREKARAIRAKYNLPER